MLFDYDGQRIERLPHSEGFDERMSRLPHGVCEAIVSALQKAIDERDSFKSIWISDALSKSQQEALLHVTGGHAEEARRFFGQIVWDVMRKREDSWLHYQPDRAPIDGVYFFRNGQRRTPWPKPKPEPDPEQK